MYLNVFFYLRSSIFCRYGSLGSASIHFNLCPIRRHELHSVILLFHLKILKATPLSQPGRFSSRPTSYPSKVWSMASRSVYLGQNLCFFITADSKIPTEDRAVNDLEHRIRCPLSRPYRPECAMDSVNRRKRPEVLPFSSYFFGRSSFGQSLPSTKSIEYMMPLIPQHTEWYSFPWDEASLEHTYTLGMMSIGLSKPTCFHQDSSPTLD